MVVGVIVASMLVIVTIVGIIGGYLFHWGWTGITNKTLWDWLQFLSVLALLIDHRGSIIDLSFADLRGVNLRHTQKLDGISLEGANLEWSDLSGAVLSDVKFQGANL